MALPTHNHRRQMLASALQDRQNAHPENIPLAHTIGLFHYWWAKALEREGQLLMAREAWLTVIANWACVLADDTFLQQWGRQRASIYQIGITSSDIEVLHNQLKTLLQEDLTNYTKLCAQAGQSLTEPLYLVFELEIEAFKVMKRVGGFPAPGQDNKTVICGPLLLRRLGLTSAFSDFLDEQERAKRVVPAFLADLQDIVKDKRSEIFDDDTHTQLMQYFSQLGIAALCLKHDYPDRTLSFLETLYPYLITTSSAVQDSRTAQIPMVIDPRSPQFKERNPGYAHTEAPGKRLFRHAIQLAIVAYLHKARLNITSDPLNIQSAVMAWQNALMLSNKIGQEKYIISEVQEMMQRRITALEQSDHLNEAIALLDATIETYSNDVLQRKFAALLTSRGIKAGNDEQWDASVTDLRRAYHLNAQTARTVKNFVIALRCLADEVSTSHQFDQSEALLHEAVTVLNSAIVADPEASAFKETLTEIQEELQQLQTAREIVRERQAAASFNEQILLDMLKEGKLDEAQEEVSKALQISPRSKQLLLLISYIHAQKKNIEGVIEIQRQLVEIDQTEQFYAHIAIGQAYQSIDLYQDALDAFWKAAVTEHTDDKQRSLACQHMADVLLVQERFKDAEAMVARALQLDADNKNAQEIRRHLQIARMRQGDVEPEELAEFMNTLAGEMDKEYEQSNSSPIKRSTVGEHSQEAAMNTIERYLKEKQITYRRQSANTFSLTFSTQTNRVLTIQVRFMDNVVFIGAPLADELPEEAMTLYTLLRATCITDIFKLCRTKSGELYIAAEIPISVLNASILENVIKGTVKFANQYPDNLDQMLNFARDLQQQATRLETSLIKQTGNGMSARDMIPMLAKRLGVSCETISQTQFLLIFGLRDFQVSTICRERSVSFIATIADMDTHAHNVRYLQQMTEINLQMNICKVALDEDNDLCFLWSLPAISEDLFRQMIQSLEEYMMIFVDKLDSK